MQPFARPYLRRRLARGKEAAGRWPEKLGDPGGAARPKGRLIWVHAVGLGEVLALRGLIGTMTARDPALNWLVTSTARSSAEVFARNAPANSRHRFLPLDIAPFANRFLDHWRPDLSIWAEQDLWPGLVYRADARGIPLALINARMDDASYAARARGRALFADSLRRFRLIAAQDADTARNLERLGAEGPVGITGSLKRAAPPLADASEARAKLASAIGARPHWLAASTHPEDEALALAAHREVRQDRLEALLTIVPRDPARGPEIAEAAAKAGLSATRRGTGALPGPGDAVHVADTFGELGLWYRLADRAFVGGSAGPVGGHNPWEPAQLDCAILHGPNTRNFRADYADLHRRVAARETATPDALAAALADPALPAMAERARALAAEGLPALETLVAGLLALLPEAWG